MSLITEVKNVCSQLSKRGWARYLRNIAGLDITKAATDLPAEFARPLRIDRTAPGLRDFAAEGIRAIEPGNPARSLLFHAIASPLVGAGCVTGFPDPDHLEVLENYVYGVRPPSIAELRARVPDAPLALVVFAAEYRPAIQTVHQRHADMCYSRTGVARVGSAKERYVPEARGFDCLGPDKRVMHVIPCRYSAYIAARLTGDPATIGPMRARAEGSIDIGGNKVKADAKRDFWAPLHKVFSGSECIRGLDLNLTFETAHQNEKLRHLLLFLQSRGIPTGYDAHVLDQFPFRIQERNLVRLSSTSFGSLTVTPLPHPLAEEARHNGSRVAFLVPPGGESDGAFKIPPLRNGGRPACEFVYVRQRINAAGQLDNLNDKPNLAAIINKGNYNAQVYIDYTGDGWVKARCEGLGLQIPLRLGAYSVMAPPDLYPLVKQQDVFDWWQQSAPNEVRETLFPDFEGPRAPEPLSDVRITANIRFRQPGAGSQGQPVFDSEDDTYTSIVSAAGCPKGSQTALETTDDNRVSPLSDGVSGLFAPGWEVSRDWTVSDDSPKGVMHLANYGSSLPFLEDARLCAAQSGFWPAVAPDTARSYEPGEYPSVTPIPDSRMGWDGVPAPTLISAGEAMVAGIAYSDYILQALGKTGFDFPKIAHTNIPQYETWTLLMARVYEALGLSKTADKAKWGLISFDKAKPDDSDLCQAEQSIGMKLCSPYRFYLVLAYSWEHELNPRFVRVKFKRHVLAFATPEYVLYCDSDEGAWRLREF